MGLLKGGGVLCQQKGLIMLFVDCGSDGRAGAHGARAAGRGTSPPLSGAYPYCYCYCYCYCYYYYYYYYYYCYCCCYCYCYYCHCYCYYCCY